MHYRCNGHYTRNKERTSNGNLCSLQIQLRKVSTGSCKAFQRGRAIFDSYVQDPLQAQARTKWLAGIDPVKFTIHDNKYQALETQDPTVSCGNKG